MVDPAHLVEYVMLDDSDRVLCRCSRSCSVQQRRDAEAPHGVQSLSGPLAE